ncbi:MAG: hypothetical protein KDD60_09470, partial [Bdellovibrionales bacterium]|nr:hypothetical protein [Bdellovibrionales bacterium]
YLHDLFTTETVLPNAFRSRPSANSSDLEKLAVAAFNAGEGRVAIAQQRAEEAGKDPGTYQGVRQYLPRSTQDYVDQVMTFKTRYSELFGASSEG